MAVSTVPDLVPLEELRKELAILEEKVVTGYTLADAIRDGARHSEHLHGDYVRDTGSCALGAAWLGAKARGFIPDA